VRTLLVVGEFTLAGLLCAGALFLLRSYQQIGARDHGFNPEGVLTFQLSVPFDDEDRRARVIEEIREQLAVLPGVASAGATTNLPWSGYDENGMYRIVGRPEDTGVGGARYQAATPGYFQAAQMRLIAGRLFDPARDRRDQPLTLIVNDALVKESFPDGNAVGAVMRVWGVERTVVGVVAGIKDFPADLDTKPAWWFPLAQKPFTQVFFAIRSGGPDPASLTASAVAAVHAVDSELAVADVRTLERRTAGALAARRFAMSLFEAFAALALVLAAAGIYGLLAFVVQQRRKELVIRVALGARRGTLARMIVGDGLKMAGAGAICSLILIPIGGVLLQSFLYNVKAWDLITIAGAPFVLLCAAILASVGPARSATRSDPALALRED
jgi:predicted permease